MLNLLLNIYIYIYIYIQTSNKSDDHDANSQSKSEDNDLEASLMDLVGDLDSTKPDRDWFFTYLEGELGFGPYGDRFVCETKLECSLWDKFVMKQYNTECEIVKQSCLKLKEYELLTENELAGIVAVRSFPREIKMSLSPHARIDKSHEFVRIIFEVNDRMWNTDYLAFDNKLSNVQLTANLLSRFANMQIIGVLCPLKDHPTESKFVSKQEIMDEFGGENGWKSLQRSAASRQTRDESKDLFHKERIEVYVPKEAIKLGDKAKLIRIVRDRKKYIQERVEWMSGKSDGKSGGKIVTKTKPKKKRSLATQLEDIDEPSEQPPRKKRSSAKSATKSATKSNTIPYARKTIDVDDMKQALVNVMIKKKVNIDPRPNLQSQLKNQKHLLKMLQSPNTQLTGAFLEDSIAKCNQTISSIEEYLESFEGLILLELTRLEEEKYKPKSKNDSSESDSESSNKNNTRNKPKSDNSRRRRRRHKSKAKSKDKSKAKAKSSRKKQQEQKQQEKEEEEEEEDQQQEEEQQETKELSTMITPSSNHRINDTLHSYNMQVLLTI